MNILHLSDIHFGRNYPCYGLSDNFKRHDEILEELIEIISNLDDALKPEHILFTGDIVWHGKTKEYAEAEVCTDTKASTKWNRVCMPTTTFVKISEQNRMSIPITAKSDTATALAIKM